MSESSDSKRARIIHLIREMRNNTVGRGCTPAEAAKFAAKAAEMIERFSVGEAELRAASGAAPEEMEVCENRLRTGKKVFNPGMTQVVNALAVAVCCKCIMVHVNGEAVYGIVGDQLDADYVCQIATSVVPNLTLMANLEGREHGYEKAGLVRWANQYLTGAAIEIRRRIETERKERSDVKELGARLSAPTSTAIAVITGETVAVEKRAASEEGFKRLYPHVRSVRSRVEYNHEAHERGREAGKRVGLNVQID